ncbi:hypothetical protein D9M68_749570 [compost metagenome]
MIGDKNFIELVSPSFFADLQNLMSFFGSLLFGIKIDIKVKLSSEASGTQHT